MGPVVALFGALTLQEIMTREPSDSERIFVAWRGAGASRHREDSIQKYYSEVVCGVAVWESSVCVVHGERCGGYQMIQLTHCCCYVRSPHLPPLFASYNYVLPPIMLCQIRSLILVPLVGQLHSEMNIK